MGQPFKSNLNCSLKSDCIRLLSSIHLTPRTTSHDPIRNILVGAVNMIHCICQVNRVIKVELKSHPILVIVTKKGADFYNAQLSPNNAKKCMMTLTTKNFI